jgi:polysaccharide pyruvyl transferase WcaK-like protein
MSSLGTGVGSTGFSMRETSLDPRWLEALQRFEHIGVRGPISLERLKQSGIERAEIIGDLALALTPEQPIADWGARRFLFNVAPPTLDEDKLRFSGIFVSLAKLLARMEQLGWTPIPVCFDPRDRETINGVIAVSGIRPPQIVTPKTLEDYFELARNASMSVGIRLHSSVLASCAGLPNILIGYRDKCADFASTVKMERNLLSAESFDEETLFGAVDEIIGAPDRIGRALHAECEGWKRVIKAYLRRVTGDRD